jgi:hypothetical protein
MSVIVDPFSMTILLILMRYATGLIRLKSCAHIGMLSYGVKIPLMRIKIIMQKNATNIYCCCVAEKVEINRASPRTAIRNMVLPRNMRRILPSNGILNAIFPRMSPIARSVSPMRRNGVIFAIIK